MEEALDLSSDRILKERMRVKEDRNILHTVDGRRATWIGHILHRNCLLKHFIVRNRMKKSQEDKEDDVSSY